MSLSVYICALSLGRHDAITFAITIVIWSATARGVIGSGKSAHRSISRWTTRAVAHRSHLQNDKACNQIVDGTSRRIGAEEGETKGPHGAMGLYQGSTVGLLPFLRPLPLVIAPHFFGGRQNTSQSRNPKLLNYFQIVVATDHVCSVQSRKHPYIGSGTAPADITSADVFFSARGVPPGFGPENTLRLLFLGTILLPERERERERYHVVIFVRQTHNFVSYLLMSCRLLFFKWMQQQQRIHFLL